MVNYQDKKLYVFGGCLYKYGEVNKFENTMRFLDLKTHEWVKPNVKSKQFPKPRNFAQMNLWQNKLLIYGGYDKSDDK